MALSDDIQDAITRHQIYILRYSAGREKEAAVYVDEVFTKIREELDKKELTLMDRIELDRFYAEVQEFSDDIYGRLAEKMIEDSVDLMSFENEWNGSMLSRLLQQDITLTPEVAASTVMFVSEIVAGGTLLTLPAMFRRNKINRIIQTLRDAEVARDVNEVIKMNMEMERALHKKQAGTLIRTLANSTSVTARNNFFKANQSYFDGYEWVAVLDSRTSLICASRDGKVYPITDDPEKSPKPPAHFSCRSTITPKLKPQYEKSDKEPKRRPATGAAGQKKVNSKTTYESWLKRQPKEFQDDVLGPSRGRLFRNGGLTLSKFVDQQGKTLTLDELRKVEPEVFNRVKL